VVFKNEIYNSIGTIIRAKKIGHNGRLGKVSIWVQRLHSINILTRSPSPHHSLVGPNHQGDSSKLTAMDPNLLLQRLQASSSEVGMGDSFKLELLILE